MKASKNNINFYLAAGIIIILLLAVFTVLRILHINQTVAAINQEERAYEENSKRLSELTLVSQREDEYKTDISLMNGLFPSEPRDYDIIDRIQLLSDEYGADFIRVRFDQRVVNNNVNVMPFNLSFKGDYQSLVKLIGDISSSKRLIRIDKIDISAVEGEIGVINANIAARAFYR